MTDAAAQVPDWPTCEKHGERAMVRYRGQLVCGPCYVAEEQAEAMAEDMAIEAAERADLNGY